MDILVNSAGSAFRSPAEDFPEDKLDFILDLNLKGTYLCCQAFGRKMLAQGKGSIINLASIGSFIAYPWASAYLASKGGVLGVTRALALEWRDRGVRVNGIGPTLMDSPLTRAGRAAHVASPRTSSRRACCGRAWACRGSSSAPPSSSPATPRSSSPGTPSCATTATWSHRRSSQSSGDHVPDIDRIVRVRAATILHRLEVPIVFGTWVMRHREFFLVRVDAESGLSGFAYGLTRDGPLAAIVDRTIAPQYVGEPRRRPGAPRSSRRSGPTTRSTPRASGCAPCRSSTARPGTSPPRAPGQSIAAYLGGERAADAGHRHRGLPAVHQPRGDGGPDRRACGTQGWRRFKLPIAPTPRARRWRACAPPARRSPTAWLGIDANFFHKSAADAIEFGRQLDGAGHRLVRGHRAAR